LLRSCGNPRMNYLARTVPGECLAEAAAEFDANVQKSFSKIHQFTEQEFDEIETRVRLPIRFGGMGLTSLVATAPIAYTASLISARAHVLEVLEYVVKDDETPAEFLLQQLTPLTEQLQGMQVNVLATCGVSNLQELVANVGMPGTNVSKLQHKMVTQAYLKVLDDLKSHHADNKQILAAMVATTVSKSSLWVTGALLGATQLMLPTQWCAAVRHRYVLQPATYLYSRLCRCGKSIEQNPVHFHSCKLIKKTGVYDRHQLVVKTISRWLNSLDAVVIHEPKLSNGTQPDMLVHLHNMSWYVEVGVTCASNHSSIACNSSDTVELGAADAYASKKVSKYSGVLAAMGSVHKFIPFIVETHGGLCEAAVSWLREVAAQASAAPASDFELVLHRLSVALQIGNAIVDDRGLAVVKVYSETGDSDKAARELQQLAHGRWHLSQKYSSSFNHASFAA
jgi:hypothetical protein